MHTNFYPLNGFSARALICVFVLSTLIAPAAIRAAPDKAIKRFLKDDWLEVKAENVVVITDASEAYARAFVEELEAFRAAVPQFTNLQLWQTPAPLKVFAIQSVSNFKALEVDSGVAGFFLSSMGRGYAVANLRGYSLQKKRDNYAREILLHEYVHYLMRFEGGNHYYPLWYREGMADFLATVRIKDNSIEYGRIMTARAQTMARYPHFDMEEIFRAEVYPEKSIDGAKFYAYSWLMLHFLYEHPQYQRKNARYLELLRGGMSVDEAFNEAYAMEFEELDSLLHRYRSGSQVYYRLNLKEPLVDLDLQVRDLRPSEIAYELAQLQLSRIKEDRDEDDGELYALGLGLSVQATALNPSDLPAKVLHVREKLKVGDNDGSTFEEVQALYESNEDDSEVCALYGDSLVASVKRGGGGMEQLFSETLKQARRKYRRAIHLDRLNTRAFHSLYHLYAQYPDVMINSEQELIEFAHVSEELQYSLRSSEYIFNLARLYDSIGRTDEALEVYGKVSQGANLKLANQARARIEELQQPLAKRAATLR